MHFPAKPRLQIAIPLLILFSMFGFSAKADQLAWLSLERAREATEFLSNQKQVIWWCACCQDDEGKITIDIERVYFGRIGQFNGKDFFQVVLVGTDAKGQAIEKYLDLAYVHINIDNVAHCLGTHLDYGCDPCTKPFPWGKY